MRLTVCFVIVCFVRSDGGDGGGEYREDVFRSGWAGQGALTFSSSSVVLAFWLERAYVLLTVVGFDLNTCIDVGG